MFNVITMKNADNAKEKKKKQDAEKSHDKKERHMRQDAKKSDDSQSFSLNRFSCGFNVLFMNAPPTHSTFFLPLRGKKTVQFLTADVRH